MTLIDDWHKVIRRAWSVRFSLLAALLSGVEVVVNLLTPAHPSIMFAAGAGLLGIAAAVSRIVAQPKLWR